MIKKLKPEEIIYEFTTKDRTFEEGKVSMPEYEDVFTKIKTAVQIDKEGFNLYIIDDFSKEKIEAVKGYIESLLKEKKKPKDICYVVKEDERTPKAMFLEGGMGSKLKISLSEIQKKYYDIMYIFYTSSSDKKKEEILDGMEKKKNLLISKLVKLAEEEGFIMKPTQSGFSFIPLKDEGEMMNEKEYEDLSKEEREDILKKVDLLKESAKDILDKLKEIELGNLDKLKILLKNHLEENIGKLKEDYKEEFAFEKEALEYLNFVCEKIEEELIEAYTISLYDDEERINEIIYKYIVNVIVDNKENENPVVIFEEDPSVANLIGSIEYENKNSSYVTDASLIKGGSILKANEGCLIIRLNNLLANSYSYYYLKKALLSGFVDLDYSKGYLELVSLKGIKPEKIKLKEKIIIIGDYQSFNILYEYDEDFKKIFKLKAEYKKIIDLTEDSKLAFLNKVFNICKDNKIKPLSEKGTKELAKYLSKLAESKKRIYVDDFEINKILTIANNKVKEENRKSIEEKDIISAAYEEELIEKEVIKGFKEKILIKVTNEEVGQVNGLSVIDGGYFSFGKPLRITCSCYKGDGAIVDVQKESALSGSIHNKAINILKGYINNLLGGYEKLPVDFHLSFEQTYGKVDGDSASVAEVVAILSSISNLPVKQNIAVTGSIDQFGYVQPIGGVNEKIEGFFKVCKLVDSIKNKGVLIPEYNREDLILSCEVENAIKRGEFNIYTMNKVEDAVNILICSEDFDYEDVVERIKKEINKYKIKKRSKN